ncbi:unnamed protein product [Cylindrotheca closterium]|uniref:Uncharacterized protein n=1 Tax=Cylindrotheca closterium TaxID=2856 RepID=A0AAD2JJY5_9STRA|nr:unnamed protein product [Cylindrotheca closterium]
MNPSSNLCKLFLSAFLLTNNHGADAFCSRRPTTSQSFSRVSSSSLRAEEEMAASVADTVQTAAESVQAAAATATAPVESSAPAAVVEAVPEVVKRVAALGDPLYEPVVDADTMALVLGQENYGLAIVLLGEGIWSLSSAPSIDQALKTLVPAAVAAAILAIVSGPMVTSGDVSQVGTGLFVADAVSIIMGLIYVARCLAPFSASPKEIPALGILVALAGFVTFSENLIVDGYVILPQLPQLPSIELPSIQLPF